MNRAIFDKLPEFEGRKEFIDAVMKQNGEDINTAKAGTVDAQAKVTELETANAQLAAQIDDLTKAAGDTEQLKAKLAEVTQSLKDAQDAANARVYEDNMTARFNKVVGASKFVNDYTRAAIYEAFKAGTKDNNGKADADVFAEITKDKAGLFETKQQFANIAGMDEIDNSLLDAERFKAMSLVERMAFANEHPKEYNALNTQ